jgi:membrane-associated phospholipid phosphatase
VAKFRAVLVLLAVLGVWQFCRAQDDAPAEVRSVSLEAPLSLPDQNLVVASQPTAPALAPIAAITLPHEKGFYWDGWKQLGPDLLRDQKEIYFRFPASVAHGKYLKPTLALAGITAAIALTDKYSAHYFGANPSWSGFNQVFDGPHTAHATEILPAALYGISVLQGDKYGQETFFLGLRAVLDSEILTSLMKNTDRRALPPDGVYSNGWFQRTGGVSLGGNGSFPSGHTIAAFAVATAYAERYPMKDWHRWAAYGLAGLVGFTRVTTHAHYGSDVFAGAALGYIITKYVVLRHACGKYEPCY